MSIPESFSSRWIDARPMAHSNWWSAISGATTRRAGVCPSRKAMPSDSSPIVTLVAPDGEAGVVLGEGEAVAVSGRAAGDSIGGISSEEGSFGIERGVRS